MLGTIRGMMAAAAPEGDGPFDIKEMILHHLADSHEWETPFGVLHLPQFDPVHLGPVTLDFSITKHVLFLFFAAVLAAAILIPAARRARKAHGNDEMEGPKGGHNVVEAFVLFLRDEVAKPNVGPHGEWFYPYIIAVFFFILCGNL
ncbi:MAG: F0F1 ATP synthase subunit A, partial [Gemmatimonadota bacterium]